MNVLDLSESLRVSIEGLALVETHDDVVLRFHERVRHLDKHGLKSLDYLVLLFYLILLLLFLPRLRHFWSGLGNLLVEELLDTRKLVVVAIANQVLHSFEYVCEFLINLSVYLVNIVLDPL